MDKLICDLCLEEMDTFKVVGVSEVCEDCAVDATECAECGGAFYAGDGHQDAGTGEHFCESCGPRVLEVCANCDDEYRRENMVYVDSDYYCESCAEEHVVDCAYCGDTLRVEDAIYSELANEYYCEDCYHEIFIPCINCGDEIRREDAIYITFGSVIRTVEAYCEYCAPEDERPPALNRYVALNERYPHYRIGLELECEGLDSMPLGYQDDGSIDYGREYVTYPLPPIVAAAVIYRAATLARSNNSHGTHINISRLNRDINRDFVDAAESGGERLWYMLGGYDGYGRATGITSTFARSRRLFAVEGRYRSCYGRGDRIEVRAFPGVDRSRPPAITVLWIAAVIANAEYGKDYANVPLARLRDKLGWHRFGAWRGLPYNPRKPAHVTAYFDNVPFRVTLPTEKELLEALESVEREYLDAPATLTPTWDDDAIRYLTA